MWGPLLVQGHDRLFHGDARREGEVFATERFLQRKAKGRLPGYGSQADLKRYTAVLHTYLPFHIVPSPLGKITSQLTVCIF